MALDLLDLCTDEIAEMFGRDYGQTPKVVERLVKNTFQPVSLINIGAAENYFGFYRPDLSQLSQTNVQGEFGEPIYMGNVNISTIIDTATPVPNYHAKLIFDQLTSMNNEEINITEQYIFNWNTNAAASEGVPWSSAKTLQPLRNDFSFQTPWATNQILFGQQGLFNVDTDLAGSIKLKLIITFSGFKLSFS